MRENKDKIQGVDELGEILGRLRERKKKIVLCHGVFDLLHIGHLHYFEEAKSHGDVLVVTLTTDEFVNRGPSRPAFPEALRAEMIAALSCVDYVAISHKPTAVEVIQKLRPHYYIKGPDYRDSGNDVTGKIVEEEEAVKSVGGQIAFTSGNTFSSSGLINRHGAVFSADVQSYLRDFSARHPASEVLDFLTKAAGLKVLLVGESIIDEYVYCDAIGKSSKEPTLVLKHLSAEKFAGGILAAANHVASFCSEVGVITMLGTENSHEAYIDRKLAPNIKRILLHRKNSPTIVKRRFVENYFFMKLMEIYEINDAMLNDEENDEVCGALLENIPHYDIVIVIDFGHSMLSNAAAGILRSKSRFLAVNAQSNAGNLGYHPLSKYSSPDYMTATESELRLEARDHRGDIARVAKEVAEKLKCGRMMVTRGNRGCMGYRTAEGLTHIPAFAGKVVDRIGAGDAFLSVSTLLAAQGAPTEVTGFAGNAAGALAVATVGNRHPIDRAAFFKYVQMLLK